MTISADTRTKLRNGVADRDAADELSDAIDAANAGGSVVANVAAIGATSNIPASAATYAIPAEPTGAEVDTAIDDTVVFIEARLDTIEAKVDAVIAAMIAAGHMSA